jgi:GT2 family glycosyltransferase
MPGSGPDQPRMLVIDGRDEVAALELRGDEPLRVLLTTDGVPCAVVDLPRLGPGPHPAIAEAALLPHLEMARAERQLRADLRGRLGGPEPRVALTTSVVICTHGRGRVLHSLLESTRSLDPAPDEVIVVDNDPGGDDCRREADQFGARYIPERRRGLNNARRTGMLAARGDVVALTDDDCILQPGWLASLSERFADPMVAAVTGPAYPFELETDMQALRERAAPYLQSLTARTFDWTTTSVVRTGNVGFGANMILRRAVLPELGELFPPELDAGTVTRSGGDLYALHRVLAAGYRVCFDPAAFLLHRHGESGESAERTAENWGTGFFAFLSRAIMRDGELAALPYATLPIRACGESLLDVLQGTGDVPVLRMRWRYLRSALGGPRAWLRARGAAYRGRSNRGAVEPLEPRSSVLEKPDPAPDGRPARDGGPALSVVVPALLNPASIGVRLRELASRQTLGEGWEAIVASPLPTPDVAGVPGHDPSTPDPDDVPVRFLSAGDGWAECANAGVAAARGEFVLLLDPLMDWDEDLLATHLNAHRSAGAETAVVGYSPLWPANRRLAALAERLRSEDGYRMTAEAAGLTFADVRATNLSVARGAFEGVGGFDAGIPAARLGWDWGMRALRAGLRIAYAPEAVAPRRGWTDTVTHLEDALAEGQADAMLVAQHPELASSLPRPPEPRRRSARVSQRLAAALLRTRDARAAAVTMLNALETVRLRRGWLWLAAAARRGAYEQGSRSAARDPREGRRDSVRVVELDASEPVPAPELAAPNAVELRLRGRPFARARPRGGHWHFGTVDEALRQDLGWRRAAAALAPDNHRPVDLTGMEVMFGPARRPGDTRDRDAFEAAGASVRIVGDPLPGARAAVAGREHWAALDGGLRQPGPSIVGVPLPGMRPEPRWLALASAGLEVDRLAAVIGAGVEDSPQAGPLHLFGRDPRKLPYEHGVRPAQFIVFRRTLYQELGGFDADAAVAGPLGPVFDFVERALEAGSIVGYRETPGISPGEHRGVAFARARWWRAAARGGLLTRRAVAIGGPRGALWFGRRALVPRARDLARALTRADRSAMGWVTSTVGFITGCSRALAGSRRSREKPDQPRATA